MDIKKVTSYCLSKPCAFMDYPFGPDPAVIKVGSSKTIGTVLHF
jgi:predicted DNA-binding protein (MmcQ/YjbR family)